jgi:hypothetical protein
MTCSTTRRPISTNVSAAMMNAAVSTRLSNNRCSAQ